jgi:hypothetical protein
VLQAAERVLYRYMRGVFVLQTAESVAESVLSLASVEACVRVTVDRAEESQQQAPHLHTTTTTSTPRPCEPIPSTATPTATDLSNLTNQALSAGGGAEGLPRDPRKASVAAQAMAAAHAAVAAQQAAHAAAQAAAAAAASAKPNTAQNATPG